jgi:hypothetical protein
MSRVLVTSTLVLVARVVILHFLAACREVRTLVESPTHAVEVRAMLDTREV